KSQTAPETKQRPNRGQMSVGGFEEQRTEDQTDSDAEKAAHDAIKKKSKNKFFGKRRHAYGQNNDPDALADGARAVEEIDNFLSARTAAECILSQRLCQKSKGRRRE